MALNHFSDLSEAEFKQYLGYNPTLRHDNEERDLVLEADETVNAPASVDWKAAGAVTPIKNQ
jgi:hypothetical protein